ncbi:MAG: integrin alpha [Myxococcota bacterium]
MTLVLLLATACDLSGVEVSDPDADEPSGDTGTSDTGDPSLADADAVFLGAPSSATGSAVVGLGDLDGDGLDDLLISAFYGERACVWYGPVQDGSHLLADGACIAGEDVYDFVGYAASRTGDLGGQHGLLVSAIGNDDGGNEAGKVYLFRGPIGSGLTDAGAASVAWIGEARGDSAGTAVSPAGDVDGDGEIDLLVGAPGNDAGGGGAGRVYLLRGPFADGAVTLADAWATFTGTSTAAPPAFAHGAATGGDALGNALAALGDVDGDGFGDVLLGADGTEAAGPGSGAVWLVRGPVAEGDHPSADADAVLVGPGPAAYAGGTVAGPGDLDGDGLDDLLVSADGWEGGRVYVVLGPGPAGESALDDTVAALAGELAGDVAGWSVAGAGDTDGDGQREVLVGAPGVDRTGEDAGAVYLVRDATRGGVLLLGEVGEIWLGEATGDSAGRAVAGAGDVDGDGLDDMLAGALYNQDGGVFAGKAYLLRGQGP